jgi:S-DNA-T family DNA segregation ATPase FtsK/SpoIIIE
MSLTSGHVRPENPEEAPPQPQGGEHALASPPEVPKKTSVPIIQILMPVMMLLMLVGMVVVMVTIGGALGGVGGGRMMPYTFMFPMMMIVGVIAMASHTVGGGNQLGDLNEDRKDYLAYLGVQRRRVQKTGAAQHKARSWGNPEPAVLASLVGSARMWERQPSSPVFAHVRVGLGTEQLATKLKSPESAPVDDLEPVTARFLKRFMDTHKTQTGIPLAIALRNYPFITMTDSYGGDTSAALTRSMLCELAVFHGPDHALVAVITDDPDGDRWGWVKWLPHNQHPTIVDAAGTARMVYRNVASARAALTSLLGVRKSHSKEVAEGIPHLVIISDRKNPAPGAAELIGRHGIDGVTLIDLQPGQPSDQFKAPFELTIRDGLLYAPDERGKQTKFAAHDAVSTQFARDLARLLSRHRPASEMDIIERAVHRKIAETDLAAHLGFKDAATADPRVLQKRNLELRDFLKLAIGVSPANEVVYLDLKETGQGGTGPHGVMIGSTGSGKSQSLRSLVLSALLTHPSDRLNALLIDYKGGAAFLGFDRAPHISAILTNMEAEAHLVERMDVAIRGEFNRRQEIFRATALRPDVHTDVDNITVYNELRDAGVPLEPLPVLFIVVDEFSALLDQHPDFIKLFAFICQVGRSMGVSLLLASQELSAGHIARIETHLSYRIALRVNDARVSREVLGTNDAYELSGGVGSAILKDVNGDFITFRSYHTGKAYVPPKRSSPTATGDADQAVPDHPRPRLFTAASLEVAAGDGQIPASPDVLPAVLAAGGDGASVAMPAVGDLRAVPDVATRTGDSDGQHGTSTAPPVTGVNTKTVALVLLDRLHGHGMAAHRIWLPPLNTTITLKELLNDGALYWPDRQRGPLRIPVGAIDTPYYQRRDALVIDLMAHNVAVIGSGLTGVSTMLQTLIMSAAAAHSSSEIQFYCLDFSNGKLMALSDLAHVGSVATRNHSALVSRTIAEMTAIWQRREKLFIEHDITGMADFRRRKAQGDPALKSDRHGDVVLIIDGWTTITKDESAGFENLENKISLLASKAKSFGVHVVIASTRHMDIKPQLKEELGLRLELRLNDAATSEVNRQKAGKVPMMPGRGIIKSTRPRSGDAYNPEILDLLVALPVLENIPAQPLSTELTIDPRSSIRQINDSNPHKAAPVPLLPHDLRRAEFMAPIAWAPAPAGRAQLRVPIGVGETEMEPQWIDFNDDSCTHFVAIGDKLKGKTSLLRHIVATLCENNPPGQSGDRGVYFLIVDYQRRLLGVLPPDAGYGAYVTNAEELNTALGQDALKSVLDPRRPSSTIKPGQLRRRDWWSGPDIFIVIDNAHEFASVGYDDPLQHLKPYLAVGRDIGFHVVGTWRSGGVANQTYGRSVLAELKNLRTPGIVMSAHKDEGVLIHGKEDVKGNGDQPAGRGMLATNDFVELVQIPHLPAPDDDL